MKKIYQKCYQLGASNEYQLCLHINEEWQDSFVFIYINGCVLTLRGEAKYLQSEIRNREIISELLCKGTLDEYKKYEIPIEQLNACFRSFIENEISYSDKKLK